ncbi:antigen KI-67 isoform X1 [Chlorella sorokiniana]|uniref:Antigen KI-67 isoform X1 n=1 Tax=Chlorella sorokiniana TaxID=3076 RepID=A0A2P6TZ26_CHLSO|nr:antigen KI-67 isoform X1 [Chlorella sorokiniana]|eukprot:PRW59322.1 antigen KI-67 isoform X1 [Chlorella sorokiniana]
MGKGRRDQAGRDVASGGGGDSGGAAAATPAGDMPYARTDCGLCKQAVDTEGEEHITGVCTACKKIPLHVQCATDNLHKILKAEKGGGGHSSKALLSMLLVADSRPWELLAAGKTPKWICLRRCVVCQEGVMETAEKVKARKTAPAAPPAPAPRPARPAPALKPALARKPAAPPPRRLIEPAPNAAARLHGIGHSSSAGSVSTFAAEQERLAKEAARREAEERKEAARARREAQEAERLSRLSQQLDEQMTALIGEPGSDADSSQEGSEGSSVAAWWPAGSAPPLPLPLPTSSPVAVDTPELSAYGGAYGGTAGGLPAVDQLAADPKGVVWLAEPQFEGREEAPPEEIDELLALMGIE